MLKVIKSNLKVIDVERAVNEAPWVIAWCGHTCSHPKLRLFISIALRIPNAHDVSSLARANERVHAHNERIFPHGKFDREINVIA